MFDSVSLAIESLRKQKNFVIVFTLMLSLVGFVFSNSSSSLIEQMSLIKSNKQIFISGADLTYDNYSNEFIDDLAKFYKRGSVSVYTSQSLSTINNSSVQLVFGAHTISEVFKDEQYRAVSNPSTCNRVKTVFFENDINCSTENFDIIDSFFPDLMGASDTIYLLVPSNDVENILHQLNSGESTMISNIILTTTFVDLQEAENFTTFINDTDLLFVKYHHQLTNGADFVVGYVYPFLVMVFVFIVLCFMIIGSSLFEEQIRIYSVHILSGLTPIKAKLAGLIHYGLIGIFSFIFLWLAGFIRVGDISFFQIYYLTYFITIFFVVFINITQKKLLANLRKDRYL